MTLAFLLTAFLITEMILSILIVVGSMSILVYIIILLVDLLMERHNKDNK